MKKLLFILLAIATVSAHASSVDCKTRCYTSGMHTMDDCDRICGFDD